mmetsp:Transcript_26192/g.42387  ORF Transcript_26192/g.42387 Transcript_26192/m.42387 type:complete len:328 (-) Transcript_26192:1697-2680(-)
MGVWEDIQSNPWVSWLLSKDAWSGAIDRSTETGQKVADLSKVVAASAVEQSKLVRRATLEHLNRASSNLQDVVAKADVKIPHESLAVFTGPVFLFGLFSGIMLARSRVRFIIHSKQNAVCSKDDKKAEVIESMGTPRLDAEELGVAAARLETAFKGLVTSSTIYIGDKLGLYKQLSTMGPSCAEDISRITGLNKRWLLEWLSQNAAAGILEFDRGTGHFSISAVYQSLLLDPRDSLGGDSMIGLFQMAPGLSARIASMVDTMQDGVGQTFDGTHKDDIAEALLRLNYSFNKHTLCDSLLPAKQILEGKLVELLLRGNMVVAEGKFYV